MVKSLVNSVKKVRPYVMLIAYGIVLSDVLNLAQEVAQEFVVSRFFPHKEVSAYGQMTQEYQEKVKNPVEQTSEFENTENGVTDVTKRNDSYISTEEFRKLIGREVALQADSDHVLPETA